VSSEYTVQKLGGGGVKGRRRRKRKKEQQTTTTSVSSTPLQELKRATGQLQPSGKNFTTWCKNPLDITS
jgi:hypothetical protein